MDIEALRTGFWHLRKGGVEQLRTWQRRRALGLNSPASLRRRVGGASYSTGRAGKSVNRGRAQSNLRVAAILDDFSQAAWAAEWKLDLIKPGTWRSTIERNEIDFLFVESAWNGNAGAWKYQLAGETAPKAELIELVATFRSAGIPTVFWNKEDPPHYEDFLDTAKLFDIVLTSDARKLSDYRKDLGHDKIGVLPFGAQPELHNPVRSLSTEPAGVAFAGMYFAHKYEERREQLHFLLDGAVHASQNGGENVTIFSRQFGGDSNYQFPDKYERLIAGSLEYSAMVPAYQDFVAFLNANSVTQSPSMCARRIFEISACGTTVVSAPSSALRKYFAEDEVFEVSNAHETSEVLRMLARSREQRDRSVHLAQRRIWNEHTYSHRAQQVMQHLGGLTPNDRNSLNKFSMAAPKKVSVIAATRRPEQLNHMLKMIGGQLGVELQLILITHDFSAPKSIINSFSKSGNVENLVIVEADSQLTLGSCLNLGIERADGDFIAKMDDDDIYGEQYLSDQVNSLRFSGADLVGKQAHYMYLEGSNRTLLRMKDREHRFTDLVMGPTLLGESTLFKENMFADRSKGEDTDFLRRIGHASAKIYSTDRFNFIQMRSSGDGHTWKATDRELAATGEVQWFGRNDEHVIF